MRRGLALLAIFGLLALASARVDEDYDDGLRQSADLLDDAEVRDLLGDDADEDGGEDLSAIEEEVDRELGDDSDSASLLSSDDDEDEEQDDDDLSSLLSDNDQATSDDDLKDLDLDLGDTDAASDVAEDYNGDEDTRLKKLIDDKMQKEKLQLAEQKAMLRLQEEGHLGQDVKAAKEAAVKAQIKAEAKVEKKLLHDNRRTEETSASAGDNSAAKDTTEEDSDRDNDDLELNERGFIGYPRGVRFDGRIRKPRRRIVIVRPRPRHNWARRRRRRRRRRWWGKK